ncbi:MAG: hypothetical protein AB1631_26900 [Acidobacteriota bacterium]
MQKKTTLSERIYKRLLRLYPAEFRDEYGPLMVQLFRDRRRDEKRIVHLWIDVVFDLAASVPAQHIIAGDRMETALQDLRRHARIFAKYAFRLIVSVLLLSGAWWIAASAMAASSEKALDEKLARANGAAPAEFISSLPKEERNDSARRIDETISEIIGTSVAIPEFTVAANYRDERDGVYYDYLDWHVYRSDGEVDEPPAEMKQLLSKHSASLERLYAFIDTSGPPRWEQNSSLLVKAPFPDFTRLRNLFKIITLDILAKTREGKNREAMSAFECAWKITEALGQRPEEISQILACAQAAALAGAMRKMKDVPADWQQRITDHSYRESLIRGLRIEAASFALWLRQESFHNRARFMFGEGLMDRLAFALFGSPYMRLCMADNSSNGLQILDRLESLDICSYDRDEMRDRMRSSFAWWNKLRMASFPGQSWETAVKTELDLQLTKMVLRGREILSQGGSRIRELLSKEETCVCGDMKWQYRISSDGKVSVALANAPEWIVKKDRALIDQYEIGAIH